MTAIYFTVPPQPSHSNWWWICQLCPSQSKRKSRSQNSISVEDHLAKNTLPSSKSIWWETNLILPRKFNFNRVVYNRNIPIVFWVPRRALKKLTRSLRIALLQALWPSRVRSRNTIIIERLWYNLRQNRINHIHRRRWIITKWIWFPRRPLNCNKITSTITG